MAEKVARGEPRDRGPFGRRDLIILGVITLLAAALRLFRLDTWALWIDESHTYRDVVISSERFWSTNLSYYPLSFLLLREAIDAGLLPQTESGLRLPFAFFGILSVPALGLVGRWILGPREGLIAAGLLAISPWHIFWSQNARSYSMVLFFALLAGGAAYWALHKRSLRLLSLSVLLSAIAGLCHPSAYVLLGTLMVIGLGSMAREDASRWRRWLPWLVVAAASLVAILVAPVFGQHLARKSRFSLGHYLATLTFFLRPTVLIAAFGGMLVLFERQRVAGLALVAWATVPILVLGVVAAFTGVTAYYSFYTLPAYLLLSAACLVALARGVRGTTTRHLMLSAVPLALLVLDLGGQSFLYFTSAHGERPRWREATRYIAQDAPGPYRVLTSDLPTLRFYLDPEEFLDERGRSDVMLVQLVNWEPEGDGPYLSLRPTPTLTTSGAALREQIVQARAAKQALYVVLTEPELFENDPERSFDGVLRKEFRQVLRLPNWTGPKDMTVLLYVLPPAPQ